MKYAFGHFHILHALTYMYLFAIPIISACLIFKKGLIQKIKEIKPYTKFVSLFLLLTFLNAVSFYIALDLIGLSGLAITGRLTTVMMILSGVVLYNERLTNIEIGFVIISTIAGLIYSFSDTLDLESFWGIISAIIASMTWLCMNILWKKHANIIDGFALCSVRVFVIGAIFITINYLATFYGYIPQFSLDIGLTNGFLFALSAILLPILPYIFTPIAYKTIGLSLTAVINSIQPATAFLIGILIFSEPWDNIKMIAAVIALLASMGFAILNWKQSEKDKSE